MLRVGLTGDLGSGKSTVARLLAARGAYVFSSDEMARNMMQPGQAVYADVVQNFGASVLAADGALDRRALARLAFAEGRVEELNALVHPAVLAEQARLLHELSRTDPQAIAVVESALIFTTTHGIAGRPWHERFDRVVLVRAPTEQKVARFVARLSAGRELSPIEQIEIERDARARLALQSDINEAHAEECLVIENDAGMEELQAQVDSVWRRLRSLKQAAG